MDISNWLSPENLDPAKLAIKLAKSMTKWEVFQDYSRRTLDYLKNGETQIAVLGAGGTGKSTFGKLITAENPLLLDSKYQPNIEQEQVKFPGGVSALLLVAPGQKRYVKEVWPKIFQRIESKRSLGIVNIVAYGYHSSDLNSFEDFGVYQTGMSNEDFLKIYLVDRRREEMERLLSLQQGLEKVKRDVWMITIVAKQDIWWNDKKDVTEYYLNSSDGSYNSVLEEISRDFSEKGFTFSHHFIGASQVMSNLMAPDGTVLAPTAAGYDLDEHLKHLHNLIRRFNELLEGKKL